MLLMTNSYLVPPDRRVEHDRLMRRFRREMKRLGLDSLEVCEQAGPGFERIEGEGGTRVVQILRFRDRQHFLQVQRAERDDAGVQQLVAAFCALINLPAQQQKGQYSTGWFRGLIDSGPADADGDSTNHAANPATG